jgi:uncharacterized protein involved in cysteine biosynthesis
MQPQSIAFYLILALVAGLLATKFYARLGEKLDRQDPDTKRRWAIASRWRSTRRKSDG